MTEKMDVAGLVRVSSIMATIAKEKTHVGAGYKLG